ncbi:MAG: hypothetical protein JSV82_08970 [Planctomycetota bacterium]|nr:MAG: hypothetical protein JSV82_08970 [Planctomycetota bacterium]
MAFPFRDSSLVCGSQKKIKIVFATKLHLAKMVLDVRELVGWKLVLLINKQAKVRQCR